jgi:predicted enzyme related to lactoylglutathione lyase
MITKMTHFNIYVLNQERAVDFYTNKLGFKIKIDVPMGSGVRWLTVCTPEQPDLEITLTPVVEGKMFSKAATTAMTDLIQNGTFGCGIFTCTDLYATYEELRAKGVEFIKPPTKEFYGFEALFKDDSGNWFSLAQLLS